MSQARHGVYDPCPNRREGGRCGCPRERTPRVKARCVVCERPAGANPLPLDVKGFRGHPKHHVEVCGGCARTIHEAQTMRNLSAIFPGLADA